MNKETETTMKYQVKKRNVTGEYEDLLTPCPTLGVATHVISTEIFAEYNKDSWGCFPSLPPVIDADMIDTYEECVDTRGNRSWYAGGRGYMIEEIA